MIPQIVDLARWSGTRLVSGDSGRYSTTMESPSLSVPQVPGRTSDRPSSVRPSFVVNR